MHKILITACVITATVSLLHAGDKPIPNRLIDYPGFLKGAQEVAALRKDRRITEDQFIKFAKEPGTIILDARSTEKFDLLHVKGARHLSLPDVTEEELAKIIPAKTARILIYCNNNFENEARAFPGKVATASLNIYTYNTLHSYGYTNVYELGPLVDIHTTKLPLEGSSAPAQK